MNELLDHILDMPVRQRVLLFVAIVFVVFGGYAYLIYWPRADDIADKEQNVESLTQDRNRKAALVANLPQAKQEVADLTRIVNVSDIGVKAPTLIDSDPVKLQTSCSATTFRFLDEEERARIAKEREKKEGKK